MEEICGAHMQRDETEMKRDTPQRVTSLTHREKVKKWTCSMCGSSELLCKVESYVLHRICKQCGFESKEMIS
jgi:predicted RNA-binding Zn-ribbon protein involved in translation (DUF1610 family)